MSDLLKRLRAMGPDGDEAADEIERLRRERDDYRDMLRGIQSNIHNMLRPVGTNQEAD